MHELYQSQRRHPLPPVDLSAPRINVNVRRHDVDPFFSGLAVGVAATLAGVLLGLILCLPI